MIPANLQETSPLIELWTSPRPRNVLQSISESASESAEESCLNTTQAVNWMVENRGGIAKIAGLLLVPAQFIGADHASSQRIVDRLIQNQAGLFEKIRIPLGEEFIEGIICYPEGWKKEDNSSCVVYSNPNGMAMASFFKNDRLSWSPAAILEKKKCPIILYDYRGVGINQDTTSLSSFKFRATYETVVVDGQAVLEYAFRKFQQVEVSGSSLGGGVATVSLDRHLMRNPLDITRVKQLDNHDSFTTTSRVVFPNQHMIGDIIGATIGAQLDAMTSMKNLIDKNVKVLIIYHKQDPVIPLGARMGDYVLTLPQKPNVTVFGSNSYGHANLSYDMIQYL